MELIAAAGSAVGSIIGIVVALLFAVLCSRIASSKGHGPILWGILGFFFSIITLIVVLILPRRR